MYVACKIAKVKIAAEGSIGPWNKHDFWVPREILNQIDNKHFSVEPKGPELQAKDEVRHDKMVGH